MVSNKKYSWLPDPMWFYGDLDEYENSLYESYLETVAQNKITFQGREIFVNRKFNKEGREISFWHLISEKPFFNSDYDELKINVNSSDGRFLYLRRCERICWIRPIIENCNEKGILIWNKIDKGENKLIIWFKQNDYAVILNNKPDYLFLITAYPIDYDNRRNTLQKEYERCKNGY